MSETNARKEVQKLQRAIVDGLENVKAIDICVFNTEHLSPLFERVIVASGASNRQTRALAASVRDQMRASGLPKPRTEGEDNGEWIIVDCGQAVVHIMQPIIRQYYNLEGIWGDKPVRLKNASSKPRAAPGRASNAANAADTANAAPQAAAAPVKKKTDAAADQKTRARQTATTGRVATAKTGASRPAAKSRAKPAAKPAVAKTRTTRKTTAPSARQAATRAKPA
ncbi:MAG: ribosome silencing factor, partial [Burkholderiaceae bacterium]|nr:ribosome silencing factor [Burkholderiaceae bacterium]